MASRVLCFCLFLLLQSRSSSCHYHLSPRFQFFDIELLTHVAEERPGNVMLSPASLKQTLFMLLEGSTGDTADELRRALRLLPDMKELREQLIVYLEALQKSEKSLTLENANGIFVSDKLKANQKYNRTVQELYRSALRPVNFSDPGGVTGQINGWVAEKTHGLIPELLDPLSVSPTSSFLVLNALFFNATWLQPFNPQLTRPRCFHRGGHCLQVQTMQLHAELGYAFVEDLRAHAVELLYEGSTFSAVLLVPHDRDGCVSVIRDLPHVSLERVVSQLEVTDVQLSLPRFSVDFTDDLVAALKETKIQKLFSSSAELSGILDGDSRGVRVDSIVQRVKAQFTERGTLASAATGAVVVPLIGSNTVRLKVDRPFLVFIRDNASGAILFEGKIEEPELATTAEPGKVLEYIV